MSSEPITIILADDHAVVRAGLRLLLDLEDDLLVVAEAGTVPDAAAMTARHRPRVLVLDLNMPGGSGRTTIDLLPELARSSPQTRVVILTMQDDPQYARAAIAAGARAYVLKEAADGELVEAVRRAAAGDMYMNPRLGAMLAGGDGGGGDEPLTERELEVLRLVALGHTSGEIAAQLHLSVRTIESHRTHIQQKLGTTTRAELVRHALDRGILR